MPSSTLAKILQAMTLFRLVSHFQAVRELLWEIKCIFCTMTQLNLEAGVKRSNLTLSKDSQAIFFKKLFSHS